MSNAPRNLTMEAVLLGSLPFLLNLFNGIKALTSEGVAFKAGILITIGLAAVWVLIVLNDAFRYGAKRHYDRTDSYFKPLLLLLVLQLSLALSTAARGLFTGATDLYPFIGQVVGLTLCLVIPLTFGLYRSGYLTPNVMMGRAFMLAVFGFCAVNFIMALLGFHSSSFIDIGEGGVRNRTLELIGISVPRRTFPLSSGQNGFAVFVASAGMFCVCAALWAEQKLDRVLGLFAALLCTVGVIMTDSRGAIFAVVFCTLVAFFLKMKSSASLKWLYFLVIFLFFSPLLIIAVEPVIVQTPLFELLDRGEFSEPLAAITTGRSYIWSAIWQYLASNPESLFVGLGQYGHVISNASREYAFVFGAGGSGLLNSTHNTLLQLLIDQGMLGATVTLTTTFVLISAAQSIYSAGSAGTSCLTRWYGAGAALMLLCLVICAQSEIALTSYLPDTLFLFYFAACLVIGKPTHTKP